MQLSLLVSSTMEHLQSGSSIPIADENGREISSAGVQGMVIIQAWEAEKQNLRWFDGTFVRVMLT
jgi:hypothetical protein